MSSTSLLSFERPKTSKRDPCLVPLAMSFIILFSAGVGMLIKLLFDISQEISAIRQNTYLMCNVLPMKPQACIGPNLHFL